ncbi:helix-turn-helix domain-containing protein [Caenispirillum salinarum]|uniref:helix-turn-helix domain-containing protein n=1 Tax=Caenispirillum salinarum TaxID=859058 RepID=UPI00384E1501
MGKPHPLELRERVVAFVDEGHSNREAARHFRVSPRFVNDMIKLRRQTGSLKPLPQGNTGRGKLRAHEGWLRALIADKGDLPLDQIRLELEEAVGVSVHRSSIGGWLHRLGFSHKKNSARHRDATPRR